MTKKEQFKAGYVAVIGRPNVGKSTLINQVLQQKLSIVSHKPQTTRHQILAIYHNPRGQIVFLDTPGIHNQKKTALNKQLNQTARSSAQDVDVVLHLVEAGQWHDEDRRAADITMATQASKILVINKVDLMDNKSDLLPFVEKILGDYHYDEVFYISALKNKQVNHLVDGLFKLLPESAPLYEPSYISDRSTRFFVSELIREQLTLRFHQELPYSLTVTIDAYEVKDNMTHIHATIWVEREQQKRIIIGRGGDAIKQVGILSRAEIENFIQSRVNLKLWVKIKSSWTDDQQALDGLGYREP
ncbi:GTPase Era [Marinicella gelatinilytica]|uniref:GTPase Era n=1 Tax=Marinicella gelatinilytica TaxID=2996017 RepID=UPI002260DBF0|nr:GTPase Era [Marinicella gelatinilytica]MCX7544621.1 GTPase Era [Marinicella gelatinilytica]